MSGLKKYSKNYDVSLINVFGEWSYYKNHNRNDINFIDLFLARKIDYKKDIHNLLKHCYCFILSSLWEDPGFVLIEAAANNASIISSDCKSGPKEFLSNGKGGLLFNSNNLLSLRSSYNHFKKSNKNEIFVRKYFSKKKHNIIQNSAILKN